MRPLASIPGDICRKLVGVVFDVDDTLTRGGRLERAAFEGLWRLHDAGLVLVAVTGRPLGFAEVIARTWPIDLAVGENGAGWIRVAGDTLQAGYWDEPNLRQQQRTRLQRIVADAQHAFPWAILTDDHWARRCDAAFDVGERRVLDQDAKATLRGFLEAQGARTVQSSIHLHADLGSHDKAVGTARAIVDSGAWPGPVLPERWLFVGDSANDAAAFAYFPHSVGVANVTEHLPCLPVHPAYVTQADRGRGFAELTETLLAHRR